MKLQVISACYQPYDEYAHQYKYFITSANKHKIDVLMYGLNAACYPGWIEIKLAGQLRLLKNIDKEITHILYTDSRDAFFKKGLDAIISCYEMYGKRLLFSASMYPQWTQKVGRADKKYFGDAANPFPHSGGYIGSVWQVKRYLKTALRYATRFGDDADILRYLFIKNKVKAKLDYENLIFQVIQRDDQQIADSCIIHLAGGYSDPKEGKLRLLEKYYDQ